MALEYATLRQTHPHPIYDYIWGTADGTAIAGVQFTSHVLIRQLEPTDTGTARVNIWFGGSLWDPDLDGHTATLFGRLTLTLPITRDGLVSVESLDGVALQVAVDRVAGIYRA